MGKILRNVQLNSAYLAKAKADANFLDALAACLCVKASYVSSTLTHFNQRKLMHLLHCNPTRCKNLYRGMLQYKLCEQAVAPIDKSYYLKMAKTNVNELFPDSKCYQDKFILHITNDNKIIIGNDESSKEYDITLKNMIRILHKLIMIDYFKVRQYCSDCTRKLEEGTFKEKKAALKKISKMQKSGKRIDLNSHKRGTSYETLSKFLGMSERYTFEIIKSMIEDDRTLTKKNKTNLKKYHKTTYDYSMSVKPSCPYFKCKDIKEIFRTAEQMTSQLYNDIDNRKVQFKKNEVRTRTIKDLSCIDKKGNYCVMSFNFFANEYTLNI